MGRMGTRVPTVETQRDEPPHERDVYAEQEDRHDVRLIHMR